MYIKIVFNVKLRQNCISICMLISEQELPTTLCVQGPPQATKKYKTIYGTMSIKTADLEITLTTWHTGIIGGAQRPPSLLKNNCYQTCKSSFL
jgi:hypothetical protein